MVGSRAHLYRYTDRIRAYVNITFTDPETGLRRSEKSLKGKWGTNGRMEQVVAPAHVATYAGNKTDGCQKLDQVLSSLRDESARLNFGGRFSNSMIHILTP